ncbi:TIR domain-containing protein [Sporomusa acidovorans]|uniref:TIR domain-containing protein n=1 Tax=Sporomusa acidovorans TaxID=112900 RepID=UPI0008803F24|nr:TIR domain-containing protein [Sporomusa acidovorans]OZC18951.1 hypothetical protein SPACI_30370 [Sporomusa acidovorans DSM 3132]SDD70216.1 MTH538 TIR-like domain [Sporomusa acidovorans]
MAHKTFISYKYSEAQDLRDSIIKALGDDAQYYKGETSDSPDLTDTTTENIKKNLKDMIWGTSVTIVIISPNMTKSKWIDWEIEYSLKEITRSDKVSRSNGVVGVAMKYNGGYSWLKTKTKKPDGHASVLIDDSKLYPIIVNNRWNQKPQKYYCEECKTIDALTGSYISLIEEEDFLSNPQKYIDNAYEKSQNISGYEISKTE